MMNIKEKLSQQSNHLKNKSASEDPQAVLTQRKNQVQRKRELRITAVCLITAAIVVYLLVGVIFGVAVVRGDSMSPAYQDGDLLFYNRLDHSYHSEDVLLFQIEDDQLLLKRVIGVSGEELDIEEGMGTVLINAMPLKEDYIFQQTFKKKNLTYPVDIGKDEYFVMGDQREDSYDSRDFGTIKKEQIKGKAIAVFRF